MTDLIVALSEIIAQKHRELEGQVHHLINSTIPDGWALAYVISNADDDKWRFWRTDPVPPESDTDDHGIFCGPDWTSDINQACHFARREDAETWAHDDEDACFIRRRIIAAGGATLEELQVMQKASDIDIDWRARAAKELCRRTDRVLGAPPEIWRVGDLLPLIRELAVFVSLFVPAADKPGDQLPAPEDASMAVIPPQTTRMMPVSHLSDNDLLRLFRAFVNRNATQWVLGAGDHHHPMWGELAEAIEGVEPTSGPEWAFIQPLNRKPHSVLIAEEAEQNEALRTHQAKLDGEH